MPPLLLLDLDGVLNPAGSSVPPGYRRETTRDFSVVVKPAHGSWLRELAEVFDVTWATTWNDRAQTVFGPLLDLPPFDVLESRIYPGRERGSSDQSGSSLAIASWRESTTSSTTTPRRGHRPEGRERCS